MSVSCQTRKFSIFANFIDCSPLAKAVQEPALPPFSSGADTTAKPTRSGQLPKSPPEVKSIDCTKTAGDGFARRMIRWSPSVQIFRRYWTAFLIRRRTISGSQRVLDSDWSRSEQHHLRRTIQPSAGNCAGQHHACQYVRSGWRHLSCRHLADAYNSAAARREHGRLYVLRRLWRSLGKCRGFLSHLLLLPINAIRLRQMLKLIKRARIATEGDTSLEWLKPFMTRAQISPGR